MRKLFVTSAVVLMGVAGTASALTVTLVDMTGGAPYNVGDAVDVGVMIDTQGATISSTQMFSTASAPGVLQANGITYNGAIWDANTGATGAALDFKPLPHGLNPTSNPFGSVPNSFFWNGNDLLATLHLQILADAPEGDVGLDPTNGNIFDDTLVNDLWPNAIKEGVTIRIVPEPVSALLLLAGLPLLRRRR